MAGKYEYYFCVPSAVRNLFKNAGYEIPMNSDTFKDTWEGAKGKKIAEFIDLNRDKLKINFKKASEVNIFDKLDLMSKAMKWIDSSIAVTYMLPEGSNWKDVYNFILKVHEKEIKSIAAFPDKK